MVLFLILGGVLFLSLLLAVLVFGRRDEEKLQKRLAFLTQKDVVRDGRSGGIFLRYASQIGNFLTTRRILSAETEQSLRHTLAMAGVNDAAALYIFVGAKIISAGCFALVALLICVLRQASLRWTLIAGIGALVVGILLPDYVLRFQRNRFLKKLEAGIPDMLDMMVICAEAGLNLEATIERVQVEISPSRPQVGRELRYTMHDLRIGADQKTALMNLGNRTELASLKRLTMTLIQAVKYGTPLAASLRELAAELRTEMLTRYEENAGKLPAILTVPMILFILPTIFIIVMGPAIMNVLHMFKKGH